MIIQMKEKGKAGFCDLICKLSMVAREYKKIEDILGKEERFLISRNQREIDIAINDILEIMEPLMSE